MHDWCSGREKEDMHIVEKKEFVDVEVIIQIEVQIEYSILFGQILLQAIELATY